MSVARICPVGKLDEEDLSPARGPWSARYIVPPLQIMAPANEYHIRTHNLENPAGRNDHRGLFNTSFQFLARRDRIQIRVSGYLSHWGDVTHLVGGFRFWLQPLAVRRTMQVGSDSGNSQSPVQ